MSWTISRTAKRAGRIVAAAAVVLVLALGVAYAASGDVRFVARAGYEEARLLLRRRSLEKLIADPKTPPGRRERFRQVLDARQFGADSLDLAVGRTYTTFVDVGRDTLVLVLSASPRFRLTEFTWWVPIVGAVPYHGYFSLEAARRDARRLESSGHDTYLRPAGAFSTLGWLSDPLFSTALSRDTVQLVETVLHELTHNTVWVPGAVAFNESFAMFVGFRAAEWFFRVRGALGAADRAEALWEDEKRIGAFQSQLAQSLDPLYRSGADSAAMSAGRDTIFAAARSTIAGPLRRSLQVYPVDWMLSQPLNNATVVASRVYHTRLDLFDRVLATQGGDLRRTLSAIIDVVKNDHRRDPFAAVEALAPPFSDLATRPAANDGSNRPGDR